MKISQAALASGAIWTVLGYIATQGLRFVTNVVLTRLLAPELFGLMLIVNTLRTGAELLSDVGIRQNVIQNRQGEDPHFYNTAWTVQIIRGIALFILFSMMAIPIAHLYGHPILSVIIPIISLSFLFSGFTALSIFLLQRRLQFAQVNIYEAAVSVAFTIVQITAAYLSPTIWALVFGLLFGSAVRALGSYVIQPRLHHRPKIYKPHLFEILNFGKWISASTMLFFVATNFDRLYLAAQIPLALLGVYSIARNVAELMSNFVTGLGNSVIFPFLASHRSTSRESLRLQLAPTRMIFLLGAALVFGSGAAFGDLLVGVLYDARYQAAGWMLSLLIVGAWFAVLCSLNEATLLGFGKPAYTAMGNAAKCAWYVIGLPLALQSYGVAGAIVIVATSDAMRYLPTAIGQVRERVAFAKQDLGATLFLLLVIICCTWLRQTIGAPWPLAHWLVS